jgi:hypothetical protein
MMDKEERKLYNKKYYTDNKSTILKKACEKVICQFCNRSVIQNNLIKHQSSKICKNKENLLKQISQRNNLNI